MESINAVIQSKFDLARKIAHFAFSSNGVAEFSLKKGDKVRCSLLKVCRYPNVILYSESTVPLHHSIFKLLKLQIPFDVQARSKKLRCEIAMQ